jgi:hypothetical protein
MARKVAAKSGAGVRRNGKARQPNGRSRAAARKNGVNGHGRRAAKRRRGRYFWENWTNEEILDLRMCDLEVTLEGSWLEQPIERVKFDLLERDIRLKPHFWLADEWFSPANVPGVAIPFYLVHPRLMRLERDQMLECEGAALGDCLKLLRHELGHAVQHGFQLQRLRRWQKVFGRSSVPYPSFYKPNPASKKFVHHLDGWYAQSHPDEDFAETFAVWMRPRSDWRRRYKGWAALRKLEFVDQLMQEIAGTPRKIHSRTRPYSMPSLRKTLRSHYRQKREHYSVGFSDTWDRDLLRIFRGNSSRRVGESAAVFLRRHRQDIRELVCKWTGEYQFTCDQVLKEMIGRCRELKLRAVGPERRLKLDFAILLTVHSMHYLHRSREWHPV